MRKRSVRKDDSTGNSAKVRAVGYARCSTEEQTKGEYNTLQSQRDYIANYIQAVHPEWEVTQFYEDGGFSGKDTNRPGLQGLLGDCEKGKIDVVVTYKLDRITRSLSDFFELDRTFQTHNVSFLSVKEQFDTSSAMGRAMRNIALTFAELEREMVAERTKDKMVAQVKQGRWPGGNLPFGYDVADGRLVPNPAEAPVLRMMFAQYLEVKSTALVRDKLIALGIQTRRANYHGKAPNIISKWSLQKVEYILRNRVYLGELNYDGVRVPEAHEAIIDDDTYALVQGQLGQRFKRPKIDSPHAYFLTGKVYCGDCGCRLTPKSTQHSKRKKAYTPYYQCYRTCKYHGLDCRVGRMNAEVLEGLFVETVSSLSANRDLLARAAEQAGELDTNLSQLELEDSTLATRESELQGKIQNILSALEQGLTSTSVQSRLSELELELGTIRAQRNMVRSKLRESQPEPIDVDAALRLFSRFKELFPTCTPEEKEALVDALLKKAVVGADKTVEFELYAEGDIGDNVVPKNKVGSGARIRT